MGETSFLAETLYHKGLVPHFSFLTLQTDDTEWGDNYEIYPIAWQPLPEPYKEAQNEKA